MSTVKDLLKMDEEKNGVSCAYPLILKVYKNMRSICSLSMKNVKIKMGGKNKDVKIDESLVAKVSFLRVRKRKMRARVRKRKMSIKICI